MLAAIIPIVAGIIMWVVTGSLLSLCFAALGPLMIVGNAIESARARRKHARVTREDRERHWARIELQVTRVHDRERDMLLRETPDLVAASTAVLPTAEQIGSAFPLVLGRGAVPSSLTMSSADESDAALDFVARAQTLLDAPIVLPLASSLQVSGPTPLAMAVVRGLAAQLLVRCGSAACRFTGEVAQSLDLPDHGVGHTIVITGDGARRVPAGQSLWLVTPGGAPTPSGIGAILDVTVPTAARLITRAGTHELVVEALSAEQLTGVLRHEQANSSQEGLPSEVQLDVLAREKHSTGLSAPIGIGSSGTHRIDLVADGPHAVVTGVTGTGKSELLCTWIAAMAREHSPQEVNFVLADFKGGMAFEPLRQLPHTAAVLTDLDAAEVRRGVQSLRAEMRRRSALLAESGARDIGHAQGLARLVIVVDEFAALLHEHAELAAIFTDIAARGRALGMHLVLGTQRATGALREALLANCPLRICLRAADTAESRFLLGTDAAAHLPGGNAGRGIAEIRRASETSSERVRVARTSMSTLSAIANSWAREHLAVSPWLPSLPTTITVENVRSRAPRTAGIVLGLSDNPTAQEQHPVFLTRDSRGLCITGGVGSGKSTALAAIAHQVPDAIVVPRDPEAAWALVCGEAGLPTDALVLCDDFDVSTARFSPEQSVRWLAAWEQHIRRSAEAGGVVVLTLGRISTAVARIVDLLPLRAVLPTANRSEHLALGGTSESWCEGRPPGRAVMLGLETQLAHASVEVLRSRERATEVPRWQASAAFHGIVAPPTERLLTSLARTFSEYTVVPLAELEAQPHDARVIAVGDVESWLRKAALWQRARNDGAVLIDTMHAGALRTLAGYSEAPPYASVSGDRMWELRAGEPPRVVRIGDVSSLNAARG